MTQYDAGPGEWSNREWESPDKKPTPHARRRRVTLPPWAWLALLVGIAILLCLGLVLIVRAIRKGGEQGTPTPVATVMPGASPATTRPVTAPTVAVTRTTPTVVLPAGGTIAPPIYTEIAPGARVVVQGTGGAGLNLRSQPTTYARLVGSAKEGATLTVLDGPKEADGYVWWKLRAPDGKEGWGAADWLVLKTEP